MKNQFIIAGLVAGGLAFGTALKALLAQLAGEGERDIPWWEAKWFKEWERLAYHRG